MYTSTMSCSIQVHVYIVYTRSELASLALSFYVCMDDIILCTCTVYTVPRALTVLYCTCSDLQFMFILLASPVG